MAAETSASRGVQVRRRLIAATVELIPERGWSGVSTRVVAERAGVATGVVHYHFASLHALLVDASVGTIRSLIADMVAVLSTATTPGDLVDLLLGALDRYSGRDPMSLLISETFLAATRNPDVADAIALVLTEFRQRLADAVAAAGVPDPEDTAAALAAAIDGLMLHRTVDPDLTAARMAPVIRRMLTTEGADR